VKSYTVQWSTRPDFTDGGINVVNSPSTSRQYNGLTSGITYYFIVAANDNALIRSGASAIRHTSIDADPPTVPVMMSEPPYTKGDINTFSWHPSIDQGIGVQWYKIQISTTENFQAGTIVHDRFVTETFAKFDGLDDETKYYARVKAIDEFLFESDWSTVEWSIQDHKGPGELGLEPLMEYLPEGPVWIEWEGAVDNSSGVDHYEVMWSTDTNFVNDVHTRDHVLGQSFQIPDLDPEMTWYIKVRSYDSLGNPGMEETTHTTIDSQPPTQPELDDLEEFTGGRTTTVSWSDSTDPLSGFDHYVLNVYTSQERVGLAFTVHTTETAFEVPGLSDGTTYYYEVIAFDRAGNEVHSALVHSTQDTKGPSVPSLVPLKEYHSQPLVRVEWGPSTDDSGGNVEYQVQWSDSVLFTGGIHESPWLTGTNYQIHNTHGDSRAGPVKAPLADGTYYIRIRSRDNFGQSSAWGNAVKVTIDTTAPDAPSIMELPEYSGGSTVKIHWEEIVEGPGLEMEYSVLVYENETEDPIMETSWTKGTSLDVSDLMPHMTYYFKVVARDHLNWVSESSGSTSTTMDVTGPKVTIANDGIFGKSDPMITGEATDHGCGVDIIELSFDGGYSWSYCTYAIEKWSYSRADLPQGTTEVLVRGHDAGGNIGDPIKAYIDEEAPKVLITHPMENAKVTGALQILGSIMDTHLSSYSLSYKMGDNEDWTDIVPEQSASQFYGILGTWDPEGLAGGDYKIMIKAVDAVGQETEKIINVTLAGANLNIDRAQITFSNSHPLPDEKVEVIVTVSNFGDSPADGVTVTIYDGDKVLHTETGVNIPANGLAVITTDLKVSGTHKITARATSDLYDSGQMTTPSVLEPAEKEMVLENFGGIFGLLALLLAIAALILVFVFKDQKERTPKDKEEKPEDKKEEKKGGVQ
jgi:fibronectin type 3 domain-containing protein